jgi:hypothetical protein
LSSESLYNQLPSATENVVAANRHEPDESASPVPVGERSPGPTTFEDAVDAALRATQSFLDQGRVPTAAAVKSRLRSEHDFNERDYGFGSFREFLLAAASLSDLSVAIPEPHSGLDATVTISETGELPPSTIQTSRHLRHDIWTAFVDWREGYIRVFDRMNGRAFTYPVRPAFGESASITDVRKRLGHHPEEFVKIMGVPFAEQFQWIKDFVNSVPHGPERQVLAAALEEDRPVACFSAALRQMPDLRGEWIERRTANVEVVVRRWMRDNALDFELYGHLPRQVSAPTQLPERVEKVDRETTERVREQVLEAVRRMPLHELLRLSIPVEYLLVL